VGVINLEDSLNFGEQGSQPHVYTVSELTRTVRGVLETEFDSVWVEGEISNLRIPASKHAYFVLKDEKSQIRCVMFRGSRSKMKYQPQDGDHVHLFGRFTVYDARGEYQIIVENLEPVGLGALQKAFEQLKEKLAKEGLFDDERKKPLPEFPWKVGVITSATGAAVRDVLNIIRRRNPKVSVLINPVKVQGEGSAEEIATAIEEMNRLQDVDVLIVGRGGGSIEDLWAFNEEVVARAIARSKIPVVSAVGHEIDFTIADFVADLRAPTPSAAAELTVPVLQDVMGQLAYLTRQAFLLTGRPIEEFKTHLQRLLGRRFFRDPLHVLSPVAQRMDDLNLRLTRSLDQGVVLQKERLKGRVAQLFQASPEKAIILKKEHFQSLTWRLTRALGQGVVLQNHRLKNRVERLLQASPKKGVQRIEEKRASLHHRLVEKIRSLTELEKNRFQGVVNGLNALSPLTILDRGYSICTLNGNALKSSGEVKPGDTVEIRLSKGRLGCVVDKTLD
jgi:exodeoxyribonuclease VII large subunit